MLKMKTAVAEGVRRSLIRTGFDSLLARTTLHVSPRSLRGRLVPRHWLYPSPTLKAIDRDGIRFELDVSDYMEWCAYFGLATEPRTTLYSLAKPGQVILDVGTNVGETLLNFAKAAGDHGKVYGFEINPRTYHKCLRNIGLNPFRNIELVDVGLGHEEARLQMLSPSPRNSGGDRITAGPAPAASSSSTTVRVTTLDGFVRERRINRIDLIKIDIEGFEMKALKGAEQALRTFKPTLFVELGDANLKEQGSSSRELVAFLEPFGYRIRHALTDSTVRSSDPLDGSHFDIICEAR
jgi:FkbM family methyltransferase